jgi:hypothetical protein
MLNAAHVFVHAKFLLEVGIYDELLRLELGEEPP